MSDFKASRDLDPADFKRFAAQCTTDTERAARRLREAIHELNRAQESVEFWQRNLSECNLYCINHGVPLSAV